MKATAIYAVRRPTFLRYGSNLNLQYLAQIFYTDPDALRLKAYVNDLIQKMYSPSINLSQLELAFKVNDETILASVLGYTKDELDQKWSAIKSAINSLKLKYPEIATIARSNSSTRNVKISYIINSIHSKIYNYSIIGSSNPGDEMLGGQIWCREPQFTICIITAVLAGPDAGPFLIFLCVDQYCKSVGGRNIIDIANSNALLIQ